MQATEPPVVTEQVLGAPPEKVWDAITNVNDMRQWYFDNIPDFRPEVGFQTSFDIQNGERHFLHVWTVTDVVPNERIQYDWHYEGYPGDSLVTFELTPVPEGTKITVTHAARADFPDEVPEFRRASCVGGWKYFIHDRLKNYVESSP